MSQCRIFGDASEFPFYDLRDVLLDLRIIASDDLLHTIHAVGIAERGYFRDRNVRRRLSGELLPVDDDLGVEDLLLDAFVEVVRHGTHEHALREVGDLRGGNQAVELREVLKAQAYGHLVRTGRGDQVVQPPEIDRGQLVDDDRRLGFSLLVDEPCDARIIET